MLSSGSSIKIEYFKNKRPTPQQSTDVLGVTYFRLSNDINTSTTSDSSIGNSEGVLRLLFSIEITKL